RLAVDVARLADDLDRKPVEPAEAGRVLAGERDRPDDAPRQTGARHLGGQADEDLARPPAVGLDDREPAEDGGARRGDSVEPLRAHDLRDGLRLDDQARRRNEVAPGVDGELEGVLVRLLTLEAALGVGAAP